MDQNFFSFCVTFLLRFDVLVLYFYLLSGNDL